MGKALTLIALAVSVIFAAGCATTGGTQERPVTASVSDTAAITTGADDFLTYAGTADYAKIAALVLPEQAKGFDPKAFVEDRFRMKAAEFQIIAWDKNKIGVTPVRGKGEMLSQVVVAVKVLALNEARPVYVNLHWRRAAGAWYIVGYPEVGGGKP